MCEWTKEALHIIYYTNSKVILLRFDIKNVTYIEYFFSFYYSERAESTGATGDRLKEGAAINQSLSALGNVISGRPNSNDILFIVISSKITNYKDE